MSGMNPGLSVSGTGLQSGATETKVKRRNRTKGLENARVPVVSAQHALDCLEEKLGARFRSVKDAFINMDYDCDGRISAAEFRVTLDLMGLVMVDEEYEKLWRYFDKNGDGAINYTEFNNRVGALIHPPITRNIIDRPRTPRVRQQNARRLALGLQKKMKNLKEAFMMIDSDGSGYISHAEFIQALRHVGLTKISHEDSYAMMMKYKDPEDGNDGISFDEFKLTLEDYLKVPEAEEAAKAAGAFDHMPTMSLNHAEKLLAEKLWGKFSAVQRAFRLFDEDKSGDLSYDEFRAALRSLSVNLTDPDFRELVAKYDTNGDGSISYEEFNMRVGPLIHPDTINHRLKTLMDRAGAQSDGLHFNPHAHIGMAKPSDEEKEMFTVAGRARLMAPRLGLSEGEAMLVHQLYGRYSELQKAFRAFDTDNSGALNEDEFNRMLESVRVRLTSVAHDTLYAKYDLNGDRCISYDELNAVIGPLIMKSEQNNDLLGISEALPAPSTFRTEGEGKEEVKVEDWLEGGSDPTPRAASRPGAVPALNVGAAVADDARSYRSMASAGGSSARSVATRDIDLGQVEDKMRKILGRSWMNVYKDMKRKQKKDGGSALSTERFRDAMASEGVPLTSKETRALAAKFAGAKSGRASARSGVDVDHLMQATFSRGSGRSTARSTARSTVRSVRSGR